MNGGVSIWVEVVAATLLILSGILVLASAIGFLRLKDFFVRMHPPALAYTGATWCVALAGILYSSVVESRAMLHPWITVVLLTMTVPVTSLLLARVALFRRRTASVPDTPPALSPAREQ
jgi:multicomponent K+:H+ antiporter subunit G